MLANAPRSSGYSLFSKRRILLLATVAGLGVGVMLADFGLAPKSTDGLLFAPAYGQSATAQRPVGFADIVEKVKPAVISVKVKVSSSGDNQALNEDNPLRGTPFEEFFRRFGSPDGGQRNGRRDDDQGA
jgi:serine protease Do